MRRLAVAIGLTVALLLLAGCGVKVVTHKNHPSTTSTGAPSLTAHFANLS
jgi:anthranilate phosphoribosyltransferase